MFHFKPFRSLAIASTFALIVFSSPLHAGVLFYEGFNYAPSTALAGQGGWTGSANFTIIGGSLGFGNLATTGNSATVSSGTGILNIATGLATPASGVRWVGFVLLQSNGVQNYQAQQVKFGDISGNEMILVGNPGASSPNSLNMGTGGSYNFFNGGTAATFNTGAGSSTTTAQFFALKYDYDNTSISFFYNPAPGSSEGSLNPLGSITATSNNLATVHMNLADIRIQTNNIYSGTVSFDEFRIGNTFADVAPIPEPSSAAALAGLATLGLAALRRRRLTRLPLIG
jgi:hypothetical protein